MATAEHPKTIFFAYTMDCERIAAESTLNNGTPSWEMSERAIRGMAAVLRERDAVKAGAFYPTPATAAKHRELFLELRREGFDIGCQFHCDTFRDGEYTEFLGSYGYEVQREILSLAKDDWEQALGLPLTTWRCGFVSANDHTFPILDELGIRHSSSSMPGRYYPQVAANWVGAHRFPHHASPLNRLIAGSLDLYEVPVTSHPYEWGDAEHTSAQDLRPDRGHPLAFYQATIDAYLEFMLRADPPVKAIVPITHNTIDYLDRDQAKRKIMEFQVDYTKTAVEALGYEFVPAALADIHSEADRIGAY